MRLIRPPLVPLFLLIAIAMVWLASRTAEPEPRSGPWFVDEAAVHPILGGGLEVLRDPGRALTLEDARSDAQRDRYTPLAGNLGAGYVSDAFWLRFSVTNSSGMWATRWLEVMPAFIDDVQVHHIGPDGRVDTRRGGDTLPQSSKEENYRGHVFKFSLSPGAHEFFIRIETTSTVAALIQLWQPDAFTRNHRLGYLGLGLYFSLIFTVMVFNLVNWLFIRRVEILVYVAFLLVNSLQWLGIKGLLAELMFPESPALANLMLKVSMPTVGALALLFYMLALELKQHHPFAFRLNVIGIGACCVGVLATLLGFFQFFAGPLLTLGLLSLLSIPWPAYRQWQTGEPAARLTAAAYVLFGVLASLNILGTLSAVPYSEWTLWSGLASNLCHVLLVHFALLQRLRAAEGERAAALERSALAEGQAELERQHREDQEKLLSMITHEIRTPVAVIDAATRSLAMLDSAPTPDRSERYDRVRRSVNRLIALTDLAMAQSGLQVGMLKHHFTEIDPTPLTHDVVLLVGKPASSRVQIQLADALPSFQGDLRTIRFALLNLIDNACKYSPAHLPVQVRVALSAHAGQQGLVWTVEDQGRGVPSAMEEKIFEKYFRAGESLGGEVKPGLGLGLYLCRHIAQAHGGWVRVEAGRSVGACFRFWLPLESGVSQSR